MSENRYQQFLKETLRQGLVELQNDPSATEVVGVPRSSFEIFVRAFRGGLPPEIQKTLPAHNLTDRKYLEFLVSQIDSLLQAPAPQIEKTLSNMPPIESLNLAYQNAHTRQTAAVSQHQKWQTAFGQQIKQYNLDLAARLDKQLQKEFPSLAAPENAGKRKILVSDMAQTIQDQGLPAIKGDYKTQAEEIVKNVAAKTIRQYSSEIEELQTEEIESKPQSREEKINTIAQNIAEEQSEETFNLRRGQIRAETPPAENSVSRVDAVVRTSVISNLPPELAQNEEIVSTLVAEIEMQIHQGPQDVSQIVQNVLSRRNVQTKIAAAKIAFSTEQQQKFIESVSPEITPAISEVTNSPQFAQTPFAGSGASFAPGGGPSVSGPMAGMAAEGSGLDDVYLSQGAPLHVFTALASPTGLVDLGKWLITAGPIRSGLGFVLDSAPGMPKIDYFHLSFLMLNSSLRNLTDQHWKLLAERSKTTPDSLENYEIEKHLGEVQQKLAFLRGIESGINSNPLLKKTYNLFFKEIEVFGFKTGIPFYNIIHPLESIKMWALGRGPLAHLGISGAIDVFSLTAKYGGAGFAYGTTEYLKNAGILALKYGLTKIKLYKIVGIHGIGGRREFVFAPTYELKIRAQKWISGKILNTGVGKAVSGLFKSLLTKLGMTMAKFLSVIGIVLATAKWFWDKVGKPALLFLFYLIATHGAWALGGALVGLIADLWAVPWVFAQTLALFSWMGVFAFIPATIAGLLTLFGLPVLGAGGGILLEGIWNNLVAGAQLNFAQGIGLTTDFLTAGSGYVAPVLGITGATVIGGTMLTQMITSSAFWIPEQTSQIQSQYIKISKTPSFSGKIGDTIEYSVTVTSLKNSLTNIKISDNITFHCRENPPPVPALDFGAMPQEIPGGGSYTFKYQISAYTTTRLNDCLIVNSATVTADVKDGPTGEQGFASASVSIGNPPFEYPSGWPVAAGCITQGPNGAESHSGDQAIDIGAPSAGGSLLGADVLATHQGTVSLVFRNHAIYGNYVIIDGSGEKSGFQSLYAHLQTIAVSRGQKVNRGARLGTVGSTGNSTGPHLHYEFRGLKMGTPYLDSGTISVPACVGREACNICF